MRTGLTAIALSAFGVAGAQRPPDEPGLEMVRAEERLQLRKLCSADENGQRALKSSSIEIARFWSGVDFDGTFRLTLPSAEACELRMTELVKPVRPEMDARMEEVERRRVATKNARKRAAEAASAQIDLAREYQKILGRLAAALKSYDSYCRAGVAAGKARHDPTANRYEFAKDSPEFQEAKRLHAMIEKERANRDQAKEREKITLRQVEDAEREIGKTERDLRDAERALREMEELLRRIEGAGRRLAVPQSAVRVPGVAIPPAQPQGVVERIRDLGSYLWGDR